MNREKEPLYRKVNSKARGCHHNTGLDAKHTRNTKAGLTKKMRQGAQRGLDYTPLYKFLLSKVGKPWVDVLKEAQSRLDKDEPIYYMVIMGDDLSGYHNINHLGYFNSGSSMYSTLIVDDNGLLQKMKPELKNEDFYPSCWCCTRTFNGTVLKHSYDDFNKKQNTLS